MAKGSGVGRITLVVEIFFRLFDLEGERIGFSGMRAVYHKLGPCLTEVSYSGNLGDGIEHSVTASLARSDDIVRGVYRVRMDVKEAVDFSRFVFFQVGSDTYNYTSEAKMALGDASGMSEEWKTGNGGAGDGLPWSDAVDLSSTKGARELKTRALGAEVLGAWANRGIVIREWRAKLGGKESGAFAVESNVGKAPTADLVPPPGLTQFLPGDYVEATFECVVMPQAAADYYGPNKALRQALAEGRQHLENDSA